ncbi:MAG: hypothetical protein HZB29_08795 [Nitrospinae bacterium]|nr:hypothetical protein [Nitrospinota bacterium]
MKKKALEFLDVVGSKLFHPDVKGRVMLVAALAVPVGIIWFSLAFRYPMIKKIGVDIAGIYALDSELDRYKLSWPQQEVEKTEAAWSALRNVLFKNHEDVSAWLEFLSDRAAAAGVGMTYTIDKMKSLEDVSAIAVVPVNIKLKSGAAVNAAGGAPQVASRKAGYMEFMEFLRDIEKFYAGADIRNVAMTGSGESASEMDARLEIWVGFTGDGGGLMEEQKTATETARHEAAS